MPDVESRTEDWQTPPWKDIQRAVSITSGRSGLYAPLRDHHDCQYYYQKPRQVAIGCIGGRAFPNAMALLLPPQ